MAVASVLHSCNSCCFLLCPLHANRRNSRSLSPSFFDSNGGGQSHWAKGHKFNKNPAKYWDEFYKRHHNKFFKDRHYLEKDWARYFTADIDETSFGPKIVLEAHEAFRSSKVNAFVCDVTEDDLCKMIMPASVDIVTMIFMLSAVPPSKMSLVLRNAKNVLKPNGYLLFRDYATGDYAQEILASKDRKISKNFYVRGDGTSAFYFSEDSLSALFQSNDFSTLDVNVYCRQITKRSQNVIMDRRWIRATFISGDNYES